ncbi:hypothetical protein KW842_12910 [Duganella sp. sic0402]|uniref:hypothetical protein n=1 Tax=Duganella sp. sic0402 TaxID=2854786 RepID=UPI001C4850EE|nr:hypothetical protein [Duganella sp. sic0402]MBV7536668.1 hypothetical protein [Duganella sp. sic0402]
MFRFIAKIFTVAVISGSATAGQVPNVALEYFRSFAKLQVEEKKGSNDAVQSEEYARWFFQGFTHTKGGIYTRSDLARDAYTKGQLYWRDHPSERDKVFAGYGYSAIEQDGVFSRGFEKSDFKPNDLSTGFWWMTTLGDVAWRDVGIEPPSLSPIRLHIVGYLSPEGQFGHLGAYKHEVLVTSAVLKDGVLP